MALQNFPTDEIGALGMSIFLHIAYADPYPAPAGTTPSVAPILTPSFDAYAYLVAANLIGLESTLW